MRSPPSIQGVLGTLEADHRRDRAELRKLAELIRAVRATAALIHELQKERGLSSGFLAAEGEQFGEARTLQLGRTTEVLQLADEAWEAMEDRLTDQEWYRDLKVLRDEASLRQITAARAIDQYTALVGRLLTRIAGAPGTSRHPQVTLSLLALFQFLLGKELAGQERALGSAVCAQRYFEPFQADRLGSLGLRREEAWTTFGRHAAESELAAWRVLKDGPVFGEWVQARSELAAATGEGCAVPQAEEWYRRATALIDGLQVLETQLFDRLEGLCEELQVDSRTAWEDSQESPDDQERLAARRIDRALTRLQAHRQSLRRGGAAAPGAGDHLTADLAAGTAAAVEEALRWRRDLARSERTVKDLEDLARKAQVLALDCQIQAVSRGDLAQSATRLQKDLFGMALDLGERIAILGSSSDRTTETLETLHGTALALRLALLESPDHDPRSPL